MSVPYENRRFSGSLIRALLIAAALMMTSPVFALPTFVDVKRGYTPSDAWLLSREGEVLQQVRIDPNGRRLAWTSLEQISPALLRAILYSEDRRFYEHSGVDWNAVAASAWRNLWNTRTRGASTLTMQLAGLLALDSEEDNAGSPGKNSGRRSVGEKLDQATTALRLERFWRKDQILEAYLNRVSFRSELQGVAAMSAALFGKAPGGLDMREAAIAAVLLRSPEASATVVSERACVLLKSQGFADECAGTNALATRVLRPPYRFALIGDAPHLARRLLKVPGERLRSTLDARLQRFAHESLRRHLLQITNRNVSDGGVLVLDNASGEVLAWVGGTADLSQAREVDTVTALRQAGSTLKPFLYEQAIEKRYLTAASILDDSPLEIPTPTGAYVPQNYDRHFKGAVSVRSALGGSLNVPAVRTLLMLGADTFRNHLRRFGFSSLTREGDYYGYSLALGSADVSLLDLTNAFRALSNGGVWSPLLLLPKASVAAKNVPAKDNDLPGASNPLLNEIGEALQSGQTRRVGSEAAAFIVSDMLADNNARVQTFGIDSVLTTPYWAAVKTGTSKDMRDNWCIGYSRRYTVGVWVGNASGTPMHDVSGVSGAAPVWREIMDRLERRAGNRPPMAPDGVVGRSIRFAPALEPPRREWFLAGTERDLIQASSDTVAPGILYPVSGSVIALDPDIPPTRQRVMFTTRGLQSTQRGWHWRLDDKIYGNVHSIKGWFPEPGDHRLRLEDTHGNVVDEVLFSVRGAVLKKR